MVFFSPFWRWLDGSTRKRMSIPMTVCKEGDLGNIVVLPHMWDPFAHRQFVLSHVWCVSNGERSGHDKLAAAGTRPDRHWQAVRRTPAPSTLSSATRRGTGRHGSRLRGPGYPTGRSSGCGQRDEHESTDSAGGAAHRHGIVRRAGVFTHPYPPDHLPRSQTAQYYAHPQRTDLPD